MNKFLIRYEDIDTLNILDRYGEITYKSPIINIVFINTQYSKEELLGIDGVLKVEKERVGKLL